MASARRLLSTHSVPVFRIVAVALAIVVVGFPAGATAASAAPSHLVYRLEAETMTLPAGARLRPDAAATRGSAVKLTRSGTLRRWSMTPEFETVTVRARADLCAGAPMARVVVDGIDIGSISVRATTWTDHTLPVTGQPGGHTVRVRYTNDYSNGRCDRNLHVDTVRLHDSTAANAGIPGAPCQETDAGRPYTPPPAGVSTTALGPGPAYYEVAPPTVVPAGGQPRGTVLVIHGGGWWAAGPSLVAAVRPIAEDWRARGWTTVNMTYRACARSVDDVVAMYDRVASSLPGPVCAAGESAGGHLAMVLAMRRPLDCVMTRGAPLDLVTVGLDAALGGSHVRNWAIAAFGEDRLAELSPTRHAAAVAGRVGVANAVDDLVVPATQTVGFAAAYALAHPLRPIMTKVLPAGSAPWTHARVAVTAKAKWDAAEASVADAADASWALPVL